MKDKFSHRAQESRPKQQEQSQSPTALFCFYSVTFVQILKDDETFGEHK
jgi:hypothetical protein